MRCARVQVVGEYPAEAIIATAKKRRCDLIVMASHGRKGVRALLLGSETAKVLAHSRIPVLVHRRGALPNTSAAVHPRAAPPTYTAQARGTAPRAGQR